MTSGNDSNTPNPFSLSSTTGKSDSTSSDSNTLDKEIDDLMVMIDVADRFEYTGGLKYESRKRIEKKIKSLIADREKQMLEFVIGEDEMVEITDPNRIDVGTKTPHPFNELRAEQRQRAKEWSERKK